jgi:hypothetical protein
MSLAARVEFGNDASDFWQVDGILNIDASAAHPFTISLASIDGLIFDHTLDHTWAILHADGGIVGFDPAELLLDASEFKNNRGGGQFSIENTATDLSIHFSSVPEPVFLAAFTLIPLATLRRRRQS